MNVDHIKIRCPECAAELFSCQDGVACQNGHRFLVDGKIFDLLPITLRASVAADGAYHDSVRGEWVELNQVNAFRNTYFHCSVFDYIRSLSADNPQTILELGGGNGFDLAFFLNENIPFRTYVFSEVSLPLVRYVAGKTPSSNNVYYLTADATRLPFEDCQFDVVFVIAALHHFPNVTDGVAEILRVLKPGGTFICGIEPNKRLNRFTKTAIRLLRPMIAKINHSPADDEAEGFSPEDFLEIATKLNARIVRMDQVWFFSGLLHYGLELLYRILRLKKRIVVPLWVEKMIVRIDSLIARRGWLRKWPWHYSVFFKKD